ncbi:LANO_0H07118g1_1 [Lachancea nothofagi CBS 11611]|uniref:LANO_0H07118g1_1 n=1 Tax=Lachancea nothofagi CBS 11611 TaxID=1266666 RepID=A0A1G4KLG1_9SACH|nr:LANO_0H07118g1_1 [Lachancea nothofagi CBS 11611]
MFKPVEFSHNVSAASSDSEVEPLENHQLQNHEPEKHVRLDVGTKSGNPVSPNDQDYELPVFQKRPLSDTPVGSYYNSPSDSQENSSDTTPVPSSHNSSSDLRDLQKTPGVSGNSELPNNSQFIHPKVRPTTIDVPGLTKSRTSPDGTISNKDPGSKLVIVMVGLPATGKSFITNKLSRFLNYSMYYCKVFNVGNTRRQFAKEHNLQDQDSNFFDPGNPESKALREKWAMDTLDQLLDYLLDGPGSVGIFDATNSNKSRRKKVLEKIHSRNTQIKVLFLESVCSDKATVEKNIQLKLFGPDYKGKDPETSLQDFKERLSNYVTAYEQVEDDEDLQYIKMIDVGKKIISYNIQGFLASQTVYYLLNFNLAERQIWITRNGESEYNVQGKIGGDSGLTPRGRRYAKALAKFIDEQRVAFTENEMKAQLENRVDGKNFSATEFFVWTSMLQRAVETGNYFNEDDYPNKQMRMLDELSAGDSEGLTYAEIQSKYPEEFEERLNDKLRYRYPGIGGESYMDVINRLRPVITEIERIKENLLIVTHRVVARVLLGYFLNLSRDIIANLDVPLHCVYCLEPKPYGVTWSLFEYDETKDTFFKVPHTELNTMKVKEVGLVHSERRYSIVPTAPPSVANTKGEFMTSNASSTSLTKTGSSAPSKPNQSQRFPTVGGGMTIARPSLRPQTSHPASSSRFARSVSGSKDVFENRSISTPPLLGGHQEIELNKLNEKLALLGKPDSRRGNASSPTHMSRSQSEI